MGYRFRLYSKKLPGHPDIVFPRLRKVILVHGCFWHGHGCSKGKLPKSKLDYWAPKIVENKRRDRRNVAALRRAGWSTLVVWQCDTTNDERLARLLSRFLGT
jgi:DNA mismatch endonuclease (patch repair protein)